MRADRHPPGPSVSATWPGYVEIALGRGIWIARADCVDSLPATGVANLLEGPTSRADGPGRGRAGHVPLRIAGRAAVGKRSRHGGGLGALLGGLFLGRSRIVRALEAAVRLRAAGVRTPDVMAAGWRRVRGPLHAHALVTEEIPRGINLHTALLSGPPAPRRRVMLNTAGDVVRTMHEAAFLHADLNLANLVLEETPRGPIAHVIDLDGGWFEARPTWRQRTANLKRLVRSWEKWLSPRMPLEPRDALAFLHSYCSGNRMEMHILFRGLARYRRRLGLRRLAWRWTRGSGPWSGAGAE